ncbi:MAG: Zn-dependent hydrolase, partial [Bacteroidetes bacterium]|nr:Zn-dependent hydrolase [Bacteroidota bacterium]
EVNYGTWDRLRGDEPFIEGVGEKPKGARFYPEDMTIEEFEAFEDESKSSLYTIVKRDESGNLYTVPYHEEFAEEVSMVSHILREAAEMAEDEGFKNYLILRADALLNDDYQQSDMAWMDMKNNTLELVIGPIEVYEDKLFNNKAAHEAYVLIKDKSWSERLAKYTDFLPELQEGLPVPEEYKQDKPGRDSEVNVYDVIYYAGDCNAGSKTIAINLPNDEVVQLAKGSRRLQLKNAMQAKFDKIMVPISQLLIAEDQRHHVTFNAFFANTMFHEIAHGLGIKNTITGKGTVREALKEKSSPLEEGKADILGLYMVTQLHDKGEVDGELMDYYVTFMAGIFRSVRFGVSSAHGQANMIRFNFFKKMEAFSKNEDGTFRVNLENFQNAMAALSEKILTLQGDGDYEATVQLFEEMGMVKEDLQAELDRIAEQGIPRDIVFEQGLEVLGITQ